jgi:CheY-specific phosphatase CheX
MEHGMDAKTVNTFTEIICSTFETSTNVKPMRCGEFRLEKGDIVNAETLMCILEFTGAIEGAAVLLFPASTANRIYSAMMMEDVSRFSDEVVEGFNELMNMVIGNVTAAMPERKLDFSMSRSQTGKGTVYSHPKIKEWLFVPMAFHEWGVFSIHVGIRKM